MIEPKVDPDYVVCIFPRLVGGELGGHGGGILGGQMGVTMVFVTILLLKCICLVFQMEWTK